MHIYAMRHGESEYNLLGLCNDDPARNVLLTETGRLQAMRASDGLGGVPFERIFSSELPRALETAEIVAGVHGLTVEPRAELNDIRSGCDGRPVAEYFRLIAHDRLHARVGDGETLLEHKRRVVDFIAWLTEQPVQQVLLVAHEETLRVILAYARHLDDDRMIELNFENCEILDFEIDKAG